MSLRIQKDTEGLRAAYSLFGSFGRWRHLLALLGKCQTQTLSHWRQDICPAEASSGFFLGRRVTTYTLTIAISDEFTLDEFTLKMAKFFLTSFFPDETGKHSLMNILILTCNGHPAKFSLALVPVDLKLS